MFIVFFKTEGPSVDLTINAASVANLGKNPNETNDIMSAMGRREDAKLGPKFW